MMLNKQRTFSGLVVQPAQKLIRLRKETSFLAFAINASAKNAKMLSPTTTTKRRRSRIATYLSICFVAVADYYTKHKHTMDRNQRTEVEYLKTETPNIRPIDTPGIQI